MSEDFRRKLDFPRAYKEGKQDFYGREFLVSPDVLIPRPETELMIDAVKNLAGKAYLPGVKAGEARLSKRPRILDVGTGSGCVAATLKLEILEAEVMACDVSPKALDTARENARRLGAKVEFIESDLLNNVEGEFEVIVANLPYVDRSWEWLNAPESSGLKYEPETALYAGDGGCALIFELIKQAAGRTKWLVLEADPCQHGRIVELARKFEFELEEIRGFQIILCTHQG